MRWIIAVLAIAGIGMQAQLWFAAEGYRKTRDLRNEGQLQQQQNQRLHQRLHQSLHHHPHHLCADFALPPLPLAQKSIHR